MAHSSACLAGRPGNMSTTTGYAPGDISNLTCCRCAGAQATGAARGANNATCCDAASGWFAASGMGEAPMSDAAADPGDAAKSCVISRAAGTAAAGTAVSACGSSAPPTLADAVSGWLPVLGETTLVKLHRVAADESVRDRPDLALPRVAQRVSAAAASLLPEWAAASLGPSGFPMAVFSGLTEPAA